MFKLLRSLPFQNLQQDGICTIKKQHRVDEQIVLSLLAVMATYRTVKKMILKKSKKVTSVFGEEWFLKKTYYICKRAEAQPLQQ